MVALALALQVVGQQASKSPLAWRARSLRMASAV
jgi:hypothetical protein